VREADTKRRAGPSLASRAGAPQSLSGLREAEPVRIPTGIGEIDRVLGGGLVPGSAVLLGGEPGIGKSTLLLQAAAGLALGQRIGDAAGMGGVGGEVLYATGEESAGQVRLRAGRLGLLEGVAADRISVVAETDVGRIVELARETRPIALIVDSIQTVTIDELEGPTASP
jgi:DNA repair protein RadA/Sms